MNAGHSPANLIYRWSAYLALPGGLWAAFELYGLTLRGTQMLFFSISHTMPFLLLVILLCLPFGLAWLAQSLVALVVPSYASAISVSRRSLLVFASVIVVHASLWLGYDTWSVGPFRVGGCLLGIFGSAALMRESWHSLRPVRQPAQRGRVDG